LVGFESLNRRTMHLGDRYEMAAGESEGIFDASDIGGYSFCLIADAVGTVEARVISR
jgi:hypothetical protein